MNKPIFLMTIFVFIFGLYGCAAMNKTHGELKAPNAPPIYQEGFTDGWRCYNAATQIGVQCQKDVMAYQEEPLYKQGFDDNGFQQSKAQSEAIRSILN